MVGRWRNGILCEWCSGTIQGQFLCRAALNYIYNFGIYQEVLLTLGELPTALPSPHTPSSHTVPTPTGCHESLLSDFSVASG